MLRGLNKLNRLVAEKLRGPSLELFGGLPKREGRR